jgi:hypothetical protein
MIMLYLSIGIVLLLFLPFYLARGIRRPETKLQTLVVSIILVAGCGLWLSLVASPAGMLKDDTKNMQAYLRSQQILRTEQLQLDRLRSHGTIPAISAEINLYSKCESLKSSILIYATANTATNNLLRETWLNSFFAENSVAQALQKELNAEVADYNKKQDAGNNSIPQIFQDMENEKTVETLNSITQVQMILLQNEREGMEN